MIHILILSLIFASYFGIEYLVDYVIFPHYTRSFHTEQVKLLEVHTFVHEFVPNDTQVVSYLNPLHDVINQTFSTIEAVFSPDQVIANTSVNSTTALAIFIPKDDAVNVRRLLFYVLSFLLFVDLLCIAYRLCCQRQEQQQPVYQEEEIIVNGRFRRIRRESNQIPREEKEEQMEGIILRRDMANGRPYWVRRMENQIPREEKEEQGEGLIMLRVEIDGRPRWIRTNSFQSRHREARLAEARARRAENGLAEERPAIRRMAQPRARRVEGHVADERPAIERVARPRAQRVEGGVAEEREALH
ncbi:uncharacterized protein LOC116300214 [Actinia tenebrosa]|uniref:Uncharacterized protein LOC116300214 n=1 Tax=Actinia tenebrosa TaxID=6105 RepID=A0A6P8I8K4_ACTTE|nr:uncharacterized protein LOC116300214 [Actinia tenebrosa]